MDIKVKAFQQLRLLSTALCPKYETSIHRIVSYLLAEQHDRTIITYQQGVRYICLIFRQMCIGLGSAGLMTSVKYSMLFTNF